MTSLTSPFHTCVSLKNPLKKYVTIEIIIITFTVIIMNYYHGLFLLIHNFLLNFFLFSCVDVNMNPFDVFLEVENFKYYAPLREPPSPSRVILGNPAYSSKFIACR